MLVCILTGFSSGLPFYFVTGLIPAWMRTQGASLGDIGLFSLAGLPYVWKFAWAPLLDRYAPPLGRRRGWALSAQAGLLGLLASFAAFDPKRSTAAVAALALVVSLFSATQDIALDAYRRELLSDRELGLGNSLFVNAYRVAALVPGGLGLILADRVAWSMVHVTVAAFMFVGIVTTLVVDEPEGDSGAPQTLMEAIVGPFREFFTRSDLRGALLLLAFLILYKLGDSMATALVTPFYLDMGFSMTEIGSVAKLIGFWSTIAGSVVGGLVMTRIGINRSLWIFGFVQLVSILGFAALAEIGPVISALSVVVLFEYLGVGLGTAAFVAFIARATNRRFTATQFALFSSFIALPRTLANATTGFIIEAAGYTRFFLLCTLIAVPGLLLLPKVAPWNDPLRKKRSEATPSDDLAEIE